MLGLAAVLLGAGLFGSGAPSLAGGGPTARHVAAVATLARRVTGHATAPAGTIATVDGGIGAGPGPSVSQSPYFTVHFKGKSVTGATGNWLYVADYANNVIRQVNLTAPTRTETVVAGDGLKGYTPTGEGPAGVADYDGQPATDVSLNSVAGLAVDTAGDLYVADQENHEVVEVAARAGRQWGRATTAGDPGVTMAAGHIYTVAGGQPYHPSTTIDEDTKYCATEFDGDGDGCPADESYLGDPTDLAFHGGNLYITDQFSEQVRVVLSTRCLAAATGSTPACPFGTLSPTSPPYTGPALTSLVGGHIYNVLGCPPPIKSTGVSRTAACWSARESCAPTHANTTSADGTPAAQAYVPCAQGVSFDPAGDLFVGEDLNVGASIVEVPASACTNSTAGGCPYGLTGPETAGEAYTVAGDPAYTTAHDYATTTATCPLTQTDHLAVGDGCPATEINLTDPSGQFVATNGYLLTVNYYNDVIQAISNTTGVVSLVGGSGPTGGTTCATAILGAGCTSAKVAFNLPTGLSTDGKQDLIVSDGGSVRSIAGAEKKHRPDLVTEIAGTGFSGLFNNVFGAQAEAFPVGAAGFSGDAPDTLPADQGELNGPEDVAFDASGDLFIADTADNRVREIPSHDGTQFGQAMTAGDSYTIAGTGQQGVTDAGGCGTAIDSLGDGCPGYFGEVVRPAGLAVDSAGDVFVADTGDGRVREIPVATGTYFGQHMAVGHIYTVAGGSSVCTARTDAEGDGCLATEAELDGPRGVAVSAGGTVYVADTGDDLVRAVSPATGVISRVAGGGADPVSAGSNTPRTLSLAAPEAVAVDGAGDLFIATDGTADGTPPGMVSEIPASSGTRFDRAMTAGDLFVIAGRITEYACTGPTGPGSTDGLNDGCIGTEATLDDPRGLALDASGDVYVADAGDGVVRVVSAASGRITLVAGVPPSGRDTTDELCTQATFGSSGLPEPDCREALGPGDLPGDGGPALDASLDAVWTGSDQVLTVDTTPDLCLAGGPDSTHVGQAPGAPCGMAVDPLGTLYIADTAVNRVRSVLGAAPPSAPQGAHAAAGTANGTAVVTWAALRGFEGSPPSSYTVTATPGGATATVGGTADRATVGGLTPGTSYTFAVTAATPGGTGPPSPPSNAVVAPGPVPSPAPAPGGPTGYTMVASDGGIFTFGTDKFYGSTGGWSLSSPVVAMALTADGKGYWLTTALGQIYNFGDAAYYGSTAGFVLNHPIVAMAATPDGKGYWLVASDGGIFSFGDAQFYGSTGALVLNEPIVGMSPTPDGKGYWLVASDGGIFSFGDAQFYGSTGSLVLNRPIVGMLPTAGGLGYWLVASDGGIFSFGDAQFYGSTGSLVLNRPVIGMVGTPDGRGYWLVASDGGIFSFGDAQFLGSTGSLTLVAPIVGAAGG
jgi:hypothetical protein